MKNPRSTGILPARHTFGNALKAHAHGIAALIIFLMVTLAAASKPRVEDVAGKLSCFCGTCPHLVATRCGCSTADKIIADVKKMIDSGMSEKQILDSFVAQYGATVLAAPPKKGFDLTAYLLPFFAFFAGAGILIAYLKRQRSNQEDSPRPPEASQSKRDEERHYRQMLERELEDRK